MLKEPKGLAALIIASKKPPKADEKMLGETEMESEEDGEDENVALETASEEVMAALDQKDPKAFAEALKAFIEMC